MANNKLKTLKKDLKDCIKGLAKHEKEYAKKGEVIEKFKARQTRLEGEIAKLEAAAV